MTLASNKQRMFYSLQDDEIPIYESYTDEEGNVIYITDDDGNKIETGETTIGYTKPVEFMGMKVPDVLLSGHHENINKWRIEQQIEKTKSRRPDLLEKSDFND